MTSQSVPLGNDYAIMIERALLMKRLVPENGKTNLLVWRDEAHFKHWVTCQASPSDGVRITKVDSSALGFDPEHAIVGVAFGKEEDYSDTRLMYSMTLKLPPTT